MKSTSSALIVLKSVYCINIFCPNSSTFLNKHPSQFYTTDSAEYIHYFYSNFHLFKHLWSIERNTKQLCIQVTGLFHLKMSGNNKGINVEGRGLMIFTTLGGKGFRWISGEGGDDQLHNHFYMDANQEHLKGTWQICDKYLLINISV